MTIAQQQAHIIKIAKPILRKSGVKKAALFGSAARGEMHKKSDIDFLVKMAKDKSLLDIVGLKLDLEGALKKKVDVVTYDSVHPLLKNAILREQKLIYEEKS